MNRGPSPDTDDFPPSRLSPSPAEVFSTSTHSASRAAVLLPAVAVIIKVKTTGTLIPSCPVSHTCCPGTLESHHLELLMTTSDTRVRVALPNVEPPPGCAPAVPAPSALLSTLCGMESAFMPKQNSPGATLLLTPHCWRWGLSLSFGSGSSASF